jgi:hypothetical protein
MHLIKQLAIHFAKPDLTAILEAHLRAESVILPDQDVQGLCMSPRDDAYICVTVSLSDPLFPHFAPDGQPPQGGLN